MSAVQAVVAVPEGAEPAADAHLARLAQAWEAIQGEPLAAKRNGLQPIMRIKASGTHRGQALTL